MFNNTSGRETHMFVVNAAEPHRSPREAMNILTKFAERMSLASLSMSVANNKNQIFDGVFAD